MYIYDSRCRHGYFHVVNNDYTHWEMYAIGGSAEPTINSQGNRYLAPTDPYAKEVIKINSNLISLQRLHRSSIQFLFLLPNVRMNTFMHRS